MNYADTIARPPRTLTELEQRLLLKVTGEHRDGFRDHVHLQPRARHRAARARDPGPQRRRRLRRRTARRDDGSSCRVFKRSSDEPAHQEVVLPDGAAGQARQAPRLEAARGREPRARRAALRQPPGQAPLDPAAPRTSSTSGRSAPGSSAGFRFHSLRHTACSNLYRRTKDIRLTQRFARHKSILTTSIYAHPSDEDLVRSVRDLPC